MNYTLLRKSLSRPSFFTSWHGITTDKKDYLSITKDQGQEGLCWAYALTATFEMSYALKSGNRLMLDPNFLYEHAVPWWKDQKKSLRKEHSECLSYAEDKGYSPICATTYLIDSEDSIRQMDEDDSFLTITDAELLNIKTLFDVYRALDTYGVLYAGIDSSKIYAHTALSWYEYSEHINHAVVITGVGEMSDADYPGVYVEILNSWGYAVGYDGLQYIKIADSNASAVVVNNAAIFDLVIGIHVDRNPLKQYGDLIWALIMTVLFVIAVVILVIISILYYKAKESLDLQFNLVNEAQEAIAV